MANPEHLQILQQGVAAWNAWRDRSNDIRPDLKRARLFGSHLHGANLRGVDFRKANLHEAILSYADLTRADLTKADLSGAQLDVTNLTRADLTGSDLSQAFLYETIFGDTTLTAVRGLETCFYAGPSTLDHRTLAQSGPLPLAFLRGCGLNDWEIEVTKLYQTGLTPTEVNDIVYRIYGLRADPLIQFYSCFISYASKDYAFAERLYMDLQNKGVRCWFAPKDMKAGDRIRDTIEQQIRLRQKLLIVLSSASIASTRVEDEVEAALDEERNSQERRTVLIPITIDHTVEETDRTWARQMKRTRHIRDFTAWEDNDAYQQALDRLLRDLTALVVPRLN